MRSIRRWLFVAAFAVITVWLHELGRSGVELLAFIDAFDDATMPARVAVDQGRARLDLPLKIEADSVQAPAERADVHAGQPRSADSLSGVEIMRLLESEIATKTDPVSADEFSRAFAESLDTPD
jgi:hypothetical protein